MNPARARRRRAGPRSQITTLPLGAVDVRLDRGKERDQALREATGLVEPFAEADAALLVARVADSVGLACFEVGEAAQAFGGRV